MMCLFKQLFSESEFASRLVWDEAPRQRPATTWGKSGARQAFDAGLAGGRETDWRPPEAAAETFIKNFDFDPGFPVNDPATNKPHANLGDRFPKLKTIMVQVDDQSTGGKKAVNLVTALSEIEFRAFSGRDPASFNDLPQYSDLATLTQEELLYKAIMGKWDVDRFLSNYESAMNRLYTICASRPIAHEAFGQMARAFNSVFASEDAGIMNEHLNNRAIKPTERLVMYRKLIAIESKYVKKNAEGDITDVCLHMGTNALNSDWEDYSDMDEDQLEFVWEQSIPFYRGWILNAAIIENRSPAVLEEAYKEVLNSLYQQAKRP